MSEKVLRLYTDEALDQTSLPDRSAFTVKVGSVTRPAGPVGFCGQNCIAIVPHFRQSMDPGDTVTVSYTKPATNPLQDAAGNETLSFTDFSVDNPIIGTIPRVSFTPTAGFGSVTLEWDRVGVTPPVTKYQVGYYFSLVELVWVDVPGGAAARTYTVTGLEGGEAYSFGMRAVNDDGPGLSLFSAVEVPRPNVETPGGFTATGAFRKLNLSWTAPGSTVTVERYQYRLSTDGGDNWSLWNDIPGSDNSTTSYIISGLPDATRYTVELRIRAGSLRSGVATDTATTEVLPSGYKGAPGAPTALRVALSHSCHVDLYWSAPASNGGKAITKYEFRYRKRNGSFGSWSSDLGDPLLTYVTLGTLACDDYTFQVRAVNANGAGPRASITFTSVDEGRPNEPVELVAAGGFRRVALSWETPRATFNRIDYYQVRYRSGEQPYTSWTRIPNSNYRTTSHTLTGLADETPYDIQVRAVNSEGAGASAQRRATTQALPVDAPSGFTATAGIRKVDLAWTAAASTVAVEAYQYRLSTDAGDTWSDWTDIAGSGAKTTRHTVSRLANGTAYTVELRIRAGTARSAAASRSADDAGRAVRAGALGDARRRVDHADVDDAARRRPGDHQISVPAHEEQPRFHRLAQHPGQRAEYDELHAHRRALGGVEIHLRGARGERGGQRPRGERRRHDGGVG